MELFYRFEFVIYFFVVLINTVLGIFVYQNNRRSATNRLYALLSLITTLWLLSLMAAEAGLRSNFYPVWFPRLNIFLSAPHAALYFLLAHTIPKFDLQISSKKLQLIIAATVVMMLLNLTPLVFKSAQIDSGVAHATTGPAVILFALFTAFFVVNTVYILIKKTISSQGVEKKQLQLVAFANLLTLGLIVGTISIPSNIFENATWVPLAPLYILIFLIFTATAILKYQLFNIKILATEGFLFLLNGFLFIQLILSDSWKRLSINSFLFASGIFISWLLIKSKQKELRFQKEEVKRRAAEKMVEQFQELDRQKTEFLTIAAHQLRTPVSIINNYVAMLQDGDYGAVSGEVKEVLGNIDHSNQWLVRLADEFLNIAHLEQGQTKYHFTNANLKAIIDSVVKELKSHAALKKLKLVWQPADAASVYLDEEKIRNVIFNFVDNAIKYSEQGTVNIQVIEELSPVRDLPLAPSSAEAGESGHLLHQEETQMQSRISDDRGLSLRVIDQGLGFNHDDEERFFQKFSRGVSARSTNVNTSSGLGLYIARMFVEGHGGHVWAKSPGLNKGSEFGFWIPMKQS